MPDNDTTLNTVYTDYADPDKMPHPEGYLGDENTPAPMSSWTDLNDRRPIYLYFLPSADSQEVYQYSTMSWIPRSSVPVGGLIVNMFSCANPAGGDFTGREACEQNALRLRADQKTRAIETSDPHFWDSRVNYVTGNLTNRNGVVWKTLQDNGPDIQGVGPRDPVTSPNYWIMQNTVANNTVLWIDHNATVPGTGLSESSPAQNLQQLINVFRGLRAGTPIFMASSVNYQATPSFYIIVKGTGDIVETLPYGLNIEHVNVTFEFKNLTSWKLDAEFLFCVNAGVRLNCDPNNPPTLYMPPIQMRGSFFWCQPNVVMSGNTYFNAVTSDVSIRNFEMTSTHSSGVIFLIYNSNLLTYDNVIIKNTVANNSSTIYIVNSICHFQGTLTSYNISPNTASLHCIVSYVVVYTSTFSLINLVNGYLLVNGGTLTLGDPAGATAHIYGAVASTGRIQVGSGAAIAGNAVLPTNKGLINLWGIVQAYGKAADLWPGTSPWQITAQGAYVS